MPDFLSDIIRIGVDRRRRRIGIARVQAKQRIADIDNLQLGEVCSIVGKDVAQVNSNALLVIVVFLGFEINRSRQIHPIVGIDLVPLMSNERRQIVGDSKLDFLSLVLLPGGYTDIADAKLL